MCFLLSPYTVSSSFFYLLIQSSRLEKWPTQASPSKSAARLRAICGPCHSALRERSHAQSMPNELHLKSEQKCECGRMGKKEVNEKKSRAQGARASRHAVGQFDLLIISFSPSSTCIPSSSHRPLRTDRRSERSSCGVPCRPAASRAAACAARFRSCPCGRVAS